VISTVKLLVKQMRIYIGYLLAGLSTFYLVMLYYGVSAGFASYLPILALVGATVLFVVAAPLLVYQPKSGLYVGAVGCLLLLPYSVVFITSIFEKATFSWPMLILSLPAILVLISSYWTGKAFLQSTYSLPFFPAAPTLKFLLCILPILLWGSYIISIWPYLS
jgi:hypothetical protein